MSKQRLSGTIEVSIRLFRGPSKPMSAQEKTRWKAWAEALRQEMMTGLKPEVTKTVEEITAETETSKAESTLRSLRFWQACKDGKSPNDVLVTAGFVLEFEPEEKKVHEVTFKLNATWMSILNRVLERQSPSR